MKPQVIIFRRAADDIREQLPFDKGKHAERDADDREQRALAAAAQRPQRVTTQETQTHTANAARVTLVSLRSVMWQVPRRRA